MRPASHSVDRLAFDSDEEVDFLRDVRPILAEKCMLCHGPDEQEAGLRLDSREAATQDLGEYAAVVPGDREASELWYRINLDADDSDRMPPVEHADKLTDEQIETLGRWIDQGAPWQEHWAFASLEAVEAPGVEGLPKRWRVDPIDSFVAARLDAESLDLPEDVGDLAWLRRATYDLTGLPPTVEEIDAFLADPEDRRRVIAADRLLDSPHYGERMARGMLDLVRFAESRGHEFDFNIPNAWEYREYLIRAFNQDVGWDQLVREHIAGDLLPEPRLNPEHGFNESVIGTGHWHFNEGAHSPVDLEKDLADATANKLEVFGKAFLGLTISCARCHDHKFDPIPTRDYYALAGYIQSASYRQVPFEVMESEAELRSALIDSDLIRSEIGNDQVDRQLLEQRERGELLADIGAAVLTEKERAVRAGLVADRTQDTSAADWVLFAQQVDPRLRDAADRWSAVGGDAVWREASTAPRRSTELEFGDALVHFRATTDVGSWFRQDGFAFWPRRAGDALFSTDSEYPVHAVLPIDAVVQDPDWRGFERDPRTEPETTRVWWESSGRMFRTPTVTLDDRPIWYLIRGRGIAFASVEHHRILAPPLHMAMAKEFDTHGEWRWVRHGGLERYAGKRAHIEFSPHRDDGREASEGVDRLVDRRRSYVAIAAVLQADEPPFPPPRSTQLDRVLARPDLYGPAFDVTDEDRDFYALRAEVIAKRSIRSRTAPALLDGNASDEWVAVRGDPHARGEVAERSFLTRFGGDRAREAPNRRFLWSPAQTSGRLQLAESLLEKAGPLVTRVVANRLWKQMFGEPLVATTDNFGTLAAYPRDVGLLDHLAAILRDGGYRLKPLLRRMVLSQTYAGALPADASVTMRSMPVRSPIRRLDAESLRDSLVAVTGQLDRTVGGPSVPVHLTDFMKGRGRPGQSGPLDGANRRTLYLSVRRNFLSPFLLVWDFPQPGTAVGSRSVSNVPAQSLAMMNDPFVIEMARRFSVWIRAERESTKERVEFAYWVAFGRAPTEREVEVCEAFLEGEDSNWPDLAHVLLQRKEFFYVR